VLAPTVVLCRYCRPASAWRWSINKKPVVALGRCVQWRTQHAVKSKDNHFIISDSISSLQALCGFKVEIDLVQKYTLTNSGKSIKDIRTFKTLNGLLCADLPLRNFSLTRSKQRNYNFRTPENLLWIIQIRCTEGHYNTRMSIKNVCSKPPRLHTVSHRV